MPVYFDAQAAADAILLVNRAKPHTVLRGRWESGPFKMLSVGFGKARRGYPAQLGHRRRHPRRGPGDRPPVAGRAGVAIVENGFHQPAHIAVVPAADIEQAEPDLLQMAWRHLPCIPFDPLDLVVLGEIGKDISGTGMDLNVVGMWRRTRRPGPAPIP